MIKKSSINVLAKLVLGLSLIASTSLLASESDHSGDHMHMGKMQNHNNVDGMTDKMMKNMKHMDMNKASMNTKAYYNKMMVDGYEVVLRSKKALKDGKNDMMVHIMKNGLTVKEADVKITFLMPSMPGMEFTKKAMRMGSSYNAKINFSMAGEWSYEIMIKDSNGKMHKTKGSVKL